MYAPITLERAEADRRMVDAIRELFGAKPLYKADPKERRTEAERFAPGPEVVGARSHMNRKGFRKW
jgi:hypothetical protein